jgi:AcrR family transcriptional regulator
LPRPSSRTDGRRPTPPPVEPSPWDDPIALAVLDLAAERGWAATSVADITNRAGVETAEFERRFASKEDCGGQMLEAFIVDFEARVGAVYDSHDDWLTALRATAYECADWAEEHSTMLRFGTIGVLEAGNEMMRVRREEAFKFCAALIDGGRAEAADPGSVPDSAPVIGIGAIMNLIGHRLQKGVPLEAHAHVPEMLYLVVRPYLGEERAREELTMPRPQPLAP